MLTRLLLIIAVLSLSLALSTAALPLPDPPPSGPPTGQDCTMAGGNCPSPQNASCTGSCQTGGEHKKNGFYDYDGDGCMCFVG